MGRHQSTISREVKRNGVLGVWAPKTRSGKRKVDLDPTTLGSLLEHRFRQDAERTAVGPGGLSPTSTATWWCSRD